MKDQLRKVIEGIDCKIKELYEWHLFECDSEERHKYQGQIEVLEEVRNDLANLVDWY